MSKYVKDLISSEIRNRLEGVADAIIVDVIGLDSDATFRLRKQLREKQVQMLVVKRSLASRAAEETPLRPLFAEKQGSVAVVWGGEDFVCLAKEMAAIDKSNEFEKFELKSGVMDGEPLTGAQVLDISKWPTRTEQLAMLVGQILGPGANLSAQLVGAGSQIAGQIKKLVENKEGEE